MIHDGPIFYESYKKQNIPFIYDGKVVSICDRAEEYFLNYCKISSKDQTFRNNFFSSVKKYLPKEIKFLDQCNLKHFDKFEIKHRLPSHYNLYSRYHGKSVKIINPIIEPPSIFIGRGDHPKRGHIKELITKDMITLNLSKNTKIPHGNWKEIVHEESNWIARYLDPLHKKYKYIYVEACKPCKFIFAHKIKKKLPSIRKHNMSMLYTKYQQHSVCCYLIDKLCIRIGNEKDEDTSETFGLCTMLTSHLACLKSNVVKFNFIGKDSIKHEYACRIEPEIYKLLSLYKKRKDNLFTISASALNNYLNKLHPHLTGKVFRTLHASRIMYKTLEKTNDLNASNLKVAKHLGHCSLETSRANYIDPRIIFAWCDTKGVLPSTFYSPTLLRKFKWAKNCSHFKY